MLEGERTLATVEARGLATPVRRRRFVIGAFWAAIAGTAVAAGASLVNMVYPRGVSGFGGPVAVPASAIPRPGDPPRPNFEGRFMLVNLAPGEGLAVDGSSETAGGLLALWRRCPHLGCTVPWDSSYQRPGDDRKGWFLCPCHGSTYTKAGLRVAGPAPRSMDTMRIELSDTGIVVQTGDRTQGDIDNAQRAVPYYGSA